MRYWTWQTDFFAILDHFSLFYLSNNLKYQNFEKIKKTPGDIIVLHKCTKSHHHMLYRSWEMERDECTCSCSFWTLLFYPLNHPKNENFKKKKTTTKEPGDVIILHKCTKKYGLMVYCSWDMARDRCNCYFSIWPIFSLFTPLKIRWYTVPEKWCSTDDGQQMDAQTGGKSDT